MARRIPRIFVSIAAYRDGDCQWTIKDLFEKAALPDRIHVGVLWQLVPERDDDCLIYRAWRHRCSEDFVHAADSMGACWARHRIQQMMGDEDFYFQIDSHMRFAPGWDDILLSMYETCPTRRAVISAYPPPFEPPNRLGNSNISVLYPKDFSSTGLYNLRSKAVRPEHAPPAPYPSWFIGAGMMFAPAAAIVEVPYDPYLYFKGEEQTVSARLWTSGWDMFLPNTVTVWHDYTHTGRPKHWQDQKRWTTLNEQSLCRARHVLGIEECQDPAALTELERYGLGQKRSLDDYMDRIGVDRDTRTVRKWPAFTPWRDGS